MNLYSPEFPHGLMFHRFHHEKSGPSGQGSLTPSEFEELLHFVGIENILSPEEWILKLTNHTLNSHDICLTFDDGLKCQYDICLPILERYDLKGFWFVFSSVFDGMGGIFEICNYLAVKYFNRMDEFYEVFFGKCESHVLERLEESEFTNHAQQRLSMFPFYSMNDIMFRFIRDEVLSKNQFEQKVVKVIEEKGVTISEISAKLWLSDLELKDVYGKGHVIGLHSYDHPTSLSKLSYDDQLSQYTRNYNHIEKICRNKIVSMSHPCNSYNNDTLKVLGKLDIVCGFRSNMTQPERKGINPTVLEMAREDSANIIKTMSNKEIITLTGE